MKKPKWDTELGRLMWLEGKKDGEIADAFGIPTSSVTSYRVRHWQKELIRKEDSPPHGEPGGSRGSGNGSRTAEGRNEATIEGGNRYGREETAAPL